MTKLYMYVTDDKYELPIAVAGSPAELARMIGSTPNSVSSRLSHKYKTIVKVEVEDDDEE